MLTALVRREKVISKVSLSKLRNSSIRDSWLLTSPRRCTVLYCTVLTSPRCCPPRTRPRPCRAPSCASSGCSASSLSSWLNINRSCLHWSEEEREDVTINDDLENDNNIVGHCHCQWYRILMKADPKTWILKIEREYQNESLSWGRPGSIVMDEIG